MKRQMKLGGLVFLLAAAAPATTLPRLSFEQLTDRSEVIVSGKITRSWTAWDAEHKYIWTHYEVAVDSAHKGAAATKLEIAEPGGVVGDVAMTISGSVQYATGESVVVFASRMPNGYLRTTGWSQGRYTVDRNGFIHGDASLAEVEFASAKTAGTPLRSLDGISVRELRTRITNRLRGTH